MEEQAQAKPKRKLIKFSQLSKKDKIFRVVNLTLMSLIVATIIGAMVWYGIYGDPKNRLINGGMLIACSLFPFLLEIIFRFRFSNVIFLGIQVYIIFAGVWGVMLNGYDRIECYDVIIHTLMGYLCAMIGIFFISRLTNYNKLSPYAVIAFCFFFALGIELMWELFERFNDLCLGGSAQGPKLEGYGEALVGDTMEDLLCNFSGALAFVIHYCIGKFSKATLGIPTIEKELAKNYIPAPKLKTTDEQQSIIKEEAEIKKSKKQIKIK